MVQMFQGLPDKRMEAVSSIGQGIGQGIAGKLGSFYANKALEETLNDKELQAKPLSERWQSLQTNMSKYGTHGQKVLENRLKIEQQKYAEEQAKLQKKEDLEKENRLFTQQKELQELKNQGKAPLGGASFQPTPPEISSKMKKIENENPDATADELENLYAESNIPQGYYSKKIETARRNDEATRSEQIKFHEESKDYAKTIRENASKSKKQSLAVKDMLKNADKINPKSTYSLFKGMGPIANKLANAFQTAEEGEFEAARPLLLEGWKEVFGTRLSDADLALLEDKLPNIGKDPQANKAILKLIDKYANFSELKQQAAEKVLKEKGVKTKHGVLRPLGYENEVENEYDQMVSNYERNNQPMKVKAPDGSLWNMTQEQIDKAKNKGIIFEPIK